MRGPVLVCLTIALGGWARPSLADKCPDGQTVTADTRGHCCFPEQVWSTIRSACVGAPRCPAGFEAHGESCAVAEPYEMLAPPPPRAPACPNGQSITDETEGHCCWAEQLWSTPTASCVGAPRCPAGLVARGETCVDPAAPLPPRPLTPSTPPPPVVVTPRRVAIAFAAEQTGDRYQVSVAGATCTTPCTLAIEPGRARVSVKADSVEWSQDLTIPWQPSTVRLAHGRRIGVVLGPALLLLGAADVAIGAYLFTLSGDFREHGVAGLACVLSGAVGIGVGIAELVLARRRRAELHGEPPPNGARFSGAGAAPLPSGGLGAGASFVF